MIERCLWTETAPLPAIPGSPLPASSDVVIIGGGYTGLSAARTLARRGIEVTVLEQHIVGWGASSRNGGFILPGYKPEMEELERRLGPERAAAMFRLTPFTPWQAFAVSLLLCVTGFVGGIVMSAIKRERGIKDWGTLIEGHGAMLDRMDSLCFSAPVYFHVLRYFFTP